MSEINNIGLNSNERILQINRVNGQIGSGAGSDTSIHAAQNEINKQVMVMLSKIQIGDVLKGNLLQVDGKTQLQLQNGMLLSAECLEKAVSEKLQNFLVVGKSRQHLELQLIKPSQENINAQGSLVDQAMQELGLKQNEVTKEAISQFMAKQLPLAKQQLVQVLQFAKALNIPTEVSTNLLSSQQTLVGKEAQMLSAFKGNEVGWMEKQLSGLLEHLPEDQKTPFIRVLQNIFDPKEIISILKEQEMSMKEHLEYKNSVPDQKAQANLPQEVEVAESMSLRGNELAEQISDPAFLTHYLEEMPLKTIKKLFKSLVKAKLTVNIDRESDLQEIEKLSKSAETIKKVAEELKKANLEGIDQSKLQQMEKMGEVVEKYNMDAQYFCFPMQVKGEKAEGELYFFKPRKNKKGTQDGMYIVLALDMPHLNKIEIHVKEQAEKVDLHLKVKEPLIKALVEKHQNELEELIKETAFTLGSLRCELMEEEEKNPIFSKYQAMTRLDTKI